MAEADELLMMLDDPESTGLQCHAALEAFLGRPVAHPVLGFVDDAIELIRSVLPGWWHTAGLCTLTGHASIGPDAGAPNAAELQPLLDSDIFANGFDADLAPGDGMHRVCRALIHCLAQAVAAKREFDARHSLTP